MLFDQLHVLASITGKAPYKMIPAYRSAMTDLQLGETITKHKSRVKHKTEVSNQSEPGSTTSSNTDF